MTLLDFFIYKKVFYRKNFILLIIILLFIPLIVLFITNKSL